MLYGVRWLLALNGLKPNSLVLLDAQESRLIVIVVSPEEVFVRDVADAKGPRVLPGDAAVAAPHRGPDGGRERAGVAHAGAQVRRRPLLHPHVAQRGLRQGRKVSPGMSVCVEDEGAGYWKIHMV